jgi:hypothetical protein
MGGSLSADEKTQLNSTRDNISAINNNLVAYSTSVDRLTSRVNAVETSSSLSNYFTKTDVTSLLAGNSSSPGYYTKTDVNTYFTGSSTGVPSSLGYLSLSKYNSDQTDFQKLATTTQNKADACSSACPATVPFNIESIGNSDKIKNNGSYYTLINNRFVLYLDLLITSAGWPTVNSSYVNYNFTGSIPGYLFSVLSTSGSAVVNGVTQPVKPSLGLSNMYILTISGYPAGGSSGKCVIVIEGISNK